MYIFYIPNLLLFREWPLLYDIAIIGGGIVGVAIARGITEQFKNVQCILIEKENKLGKHQSSHNSGIVHSGIYYKPGSLKAQLCSKGLDQIINYCNEHGIPYKMNGKLIVAKDHTETNALSMLYNRAKQNNVQDIEMLYTRQQIRKIEPKCNGIQALWCPNTSNVNWSFVTEHFANDFRRNGGDILLNNEVIDIQPSSDSAYPIRIISRASNEIKSKYLIICGGLRSGELSNIVDRISEEKATYLSLKVDYHLTETRRFNTNIYGVPNVELPFLGPHISPRLDGDVLLGPAAIPAYGMEGYRYSECGFTYLKNIMNTSNFQNMTRRYFFTCLNQLFSTFSPNYQAQQLQRLAEINAADIKPGPTAVQGVLINKDGTFVDDFVFDFFKGDGIRKRIINCKFLPSPAASCSMSIAKFVVDNFTANIEDNIFNL
ncbi:hypothetical protein NQ317_010957 [Molorchus minor]|uniref:L-2-hydroxyglutarate dehydrogenase, mitochondrial n=1 Tax=Molorchus minor TaxID=1323400 RepID=A0ABQ9JVJ4_9CUCU|nr:hypothetical protein NQ317_010957 [Molorchus minor]